MLEQLLFVLLFQYQVSDLPSISLVSFILSSGWGWTSLGSRLALSLLFLNIRIEAALAELCWSRWRLDGIFLGRNNLEQ